MFLDSEKVMRLLKQEFPDTLPRNCETIEDLKKLQGQYQVIDWLESLFESDEMRP